MKAGRALLLVLVIAAAVPHKAWAQSLVADLSEDLIAITTGFTGSDVLLFGATDGIGDIIVVVRGPLSRLVIRRKSRVAGIWANTDAVEFAGVPSFYHVAASQPPADILAADVREQEQIGLDQLRIASADTGNDPELPKFAAALIRNKQAASLYYSSVGEVEVIEDRLFRTNVTFPANVSTGSYMVDTYQIVDGAIASKTTTPLQIRKIGFEAGVFDFAHSNPALYGLIAILVALVAGWIAGYIFRKA